MYHIFLKPYSSMTAVRNYAHRNFSDTSTFMLLGETSGSNKRYEILSNRLLSQQEIKSLLQCSAISGYRTELDGKIIF